MAADRPEVLTSLPRSRPTRRSAKRSGAGEGETATPAAKPTPVRVAAKPKPKPNAAKKPAAKKAPAKPKRTPAAKQKPKPKAAARPRAKTAPRAKARPALTEVAPQQRPEPVSSGAPGLADFPKEPPSGPVDPPSGGELLQSAAKAAGEIAQAGITVGREALKSVARRLPRP
jgi:outer membrane biosynthesis protein TonB